MAKKIPVITDELLRAFHTKADALREEILSTPNMEIPTGSTVYYLSPNGNDNNDGRSPATAWKTIERLKAMKLPYGSYVCFALRNWQGIEEKLEGIRAAARHAYRSHGLIPVFLAVEKFKDPDMARRCVEGLDVPYHVILDASSFESIIAVLSRMRMVVSMRLHGLIFAAGQGIPLVGVVYDPKVSAFLRYIGEEHFVTLEDLSAETMCRCMDEAMAAKREPAAVEQLLEMEKVNTTVAEKLYHG